MKLWVDDIRPAPEGYSWRKSVDSAKDFIEEAEWYNDYVCDCPIELIDIDHDAGDFAIDGGDYIKLLDWLEETGRNYPIRIHMYILLQFLITFLVLYLTLFCHHILFLICKLLLQRWHLKLQLP